jgi:hypothetical protein
MQKLVLLYNRSDGYTFSVIETIPFKYESKEKAEYDFLEKWEEFHNNLNKSNTSCDIKFAGIDIDLHDFTIYEKDKKTKDYKPIFIEPGIFELEEWFDKYKSNNEN